MFYHHLSSSFSHSKTSKFLGVPFVRLLPSFSSRSAEDALSESQRSGKAPVALHVLVRRPRYHSLGRPWVEGFRKWPAGKTEKLVRKRGFIWLYMVTYGFTWFNRDYIEIILGLQWKKPNNIEDLLDWLKETS